MEQGAEGMSQWHVASHQFTEVSQGVTPGHHMGAESMEVGEVREAEIRRIRGLRNSLGREGMQGRQH